MKVAWSPTTRTYTPQQVHPVLPLMNPDELPVQNGSPAHVVATNSDLRRPGVFVKRNIFEELDQMKNEIQNLQTNVQDLRGQVAASNLTMLAWSSDLREAQDQAQEEVGQIRGELRDMQQYIARCCICMDRSPNVRVSCGHAVCSVCVERLARCPFCSVAFSSPPRALHL